MIVGALRHEEAMTFNDKAGHHSFSSYGSFEVFWSGKDDLHVTEFTADMEDYTEPMTPGWYWWACFPGCLPDSDPFGPFNNSVDAWEDAIGDVDSFDYSRD